MKKRCLGYAWRTASPDRRRHLIRPLGWAVLASGTVMLCACPAKEPPLPGGGEHRITQIELLSRSNPTLLKENNPTTLAVGQQLPLRVDACWAIPSVTEETGKATFSVDEAAVGKVDDDGIFHALSPGRVSVTAQVRVARGHSDEVVAPDQSAGDHPVITLSDVIKLTVVEEEAAGGP